MLSKCYFFLFIYFKFYKILISIKGLKTLKCFMAFKEGEITV